MKIIISDCQWNSFQMHWNALKCISLRPQFLSRHWKIEDRRWTIVRGSNQCQTKQRKYYCQSCIRAIPQSIYAGWCVTEYIKLHGMQSQTDPLLLTNYRFYWSMNYLSENLTNLYLNFLFAPSSALSYLYTMTITLTVYNYTLFQQIPTSANMPLHITTTLHVSQPHSQGCTNCPLTIHDPILHLLLPIIPSPSDS